MEIAPGIRRLGSGGIINVYLLEESGSVTIIDAGVAGYWNELPRELEAMGRTLADVRAVLLTHAHSDHVGFAERIRRERRVPIHVHEADAALARGEVKPQNQKSGQVRIRSLLRFLWYGFRHGALRTTPIRDVATFGDGATLDVPGTPRVILVPGHTAGSAVLHVPGRDTLFVGDAFATRNVVSGAVGPQIAPFGSDQRQALASLSRLENVDAPLALPGHGDPWTGGIPAALAAVRRAEEHARW